MIPLDYFLSVLPGTVVKVLLSGRWYSLEGTLSRLQSHASVCYRHHHSHHVENVAKKLRGSAGLGGLDANNLSQHLLRYKDTREDLHHEVAELTMWFPSCQDVSSHSITIQGFVRLASVNHGAACSPNAFFQ